MLRHTNCHPQGVRYFLLKLFMNVLKCASYFYNYCNRHLRAFVGGIKNNLCGKLVLNIMCCYRTFINL